MSIAESKNECADALSVSPTPVCIGLHTNNNDHARTLKILEPIIRVRWITETQKDPASTKKGQTNQPVDCGHYTEGDVFAQ